MRLFPTSTRSLYRLRIISVSTEPVEAVEQFLERSVPGLDDKTYRELTNNYSLTADPDRSVYDDYMSASGVFALPAAFVVGKSGFVEWIGHPTQIDQPLEAIVSDTWDRDAFADEFQHKQTALAAVKRISELRNAKGEAPDNVLAAIDQELKGLQHFNFPEVQLLRVLRTQLLVSLGRLDEAKEAVHEALNLSGDDVQSISVAAGGILSLPSTATIGVVITYYFRRSNRGGYTTRQEPGRCVFPSPCLLGRPSGDCGFHADQRWRNQGPFPRPVIFDRMRPFRVETSLSSGNWRGRARCFSACFSAPPLCVG